MNRTNKVWMTMALVAFTAACDSDESVAARDAGSAGDPSAGSGDGGSDGSAEASVEAGPGSFTVDLACDPAFFTLMDGPEMGVSPHGRMQIWYSKNIEAVIREEAFVVPEGTVSIKEFDADSDGTVDGFAVMVKREEGYDPDNGNWHYEMRDPNGELMPEPAPGPIPLCVNCHAGWEDTDYLAGTMLD